MYDVLKAGQTALIDCVPVQLGRQMCLVIFHGEILVSLM